MAMAYDQSLSAQTPCIIDKSLASLFHTFLPTACIEQDSDELVYDLKLLHKQCDSLCMRCHMKRKSDENANRFSEMMPTRLDKIARRNHSSFSAYRRKMSQRDPENPPLIEDPL